MTRRPAAARSLASWALALALASPLFASPLQAQFPGGASNQRPIRVAISGGLTLPSGDLKDFHDSGFHYDGSLIFNIPGLPFTIRPEVSLTTLKLKTTGLPSGSPTTGYGSGDNTRFLSGVGNIEVPLAGGLYLLGGVGAMNLKTDVAGTSSTELSQTNLVINAGAGFRFHISRIDGFVEGRVGTASYEQGKVGYSKAQFIPISFGLVF